MNKTQAKRHINTTQPRTDSYGSDAAVKRAMAGHAALPPTVSTLNWDLISKRHVWRKANFYPQSNITIAKEVLEACWRI